MEKKRSNILYYTMLTFVSLLLSGWIITISNHKDKENAILQTQIDSLIVLANKLHGQDTTINIQEYLPSKKVEPDTFEYIVIIHSIVIGVLILFVFMYIRCMKNLKIDNKEKCGCLIFRRRKKTN